MLRTVSLSSVMPALGLACVSKTPFDKLRARAFPELVEGNDEAT